MRFEVENHLWNKRDGYWYGFGSMAKGLHVDGRAALVSLRPKQDGVRLYWASPEGDFRRSVLPPPAGYAPHGSRVTTAAAGFMMAVGGRLYIRRTV